MREREKEEKKVVKKKGGKKRKKAGEEDDGFIDDREDELEENDGNSMSIEDMKNRNATMKKLVEKRSKRARTNSGSDNEKDKSTGLYKDNASRMCRIKFFIALASHSVNAMWNEEDEKKRETISQRAVGSSTSHDISGQGTHVYGQE